MAEYISKYKASKIDSILSEVENSIKPGLATLKTNSETSIKELQENKQENIEDIDSIRSGAALGATAIQKVKTINGISIEGEGDINILGSTSTGGTENVFADADCRKAFIDEMAFISQRVGAKSSKWNDPTGIENLSTAEDMCKILMHASGFEKLYDIWNTPTWQPRKIAADGSLVSGITITSSVVGNDASKQLTQYYNVMGGKTGSMNRTSTRNLGVIMQSAKDANKMYAVIVMQADTANEGAGNRFAATKRVMDILETQNTSNGSNAPSAPSVLDEVAYENLTWRQIFINNNYAPNLNNGNYTSNKADTYAVSAGTCTIVTDEAVADNYVPPYALDVSGTTSCQLKSGKVELNKLYLMACNVNVSAYTTGYCGVIIGSGSKSATINRVTDGWEAITQRITPETSSAATLYVGSASSANLTGKVNNPVIIPASIFTNVPDEETWQQLFEQYNAKLIEEQTAKDNTEGETNVEEIDLPEPQAQYICAYVLPRFPRAFQYLTLTPAYEKKATTEWYPASMSKILTALVVLNYVADLNEKVKVVQEDVDALIAYGTGWYANDILVGETVTYLDLLYYMMLPSSNIATQIVCRAVGAKILKSRNLSSNK